MTCTEGKFPNGKNYLRNKKKTMERDLFDSYCSSHSAAIEEIKTAAWALHESVNQRYDDTLPYGHHLSAVAGAAMKYGYEVVACEEDVTPVIFAAYYHDSIEDARLTYNDVMKIAKKKMNDAQALMATEIVYALTNDKGRTRAERAGEKYYEGIRTTPYAPLIKLCDRYANMSYSFHGMDDSNIHMRDVYAREWSHFIAAITAKTNDVRYQLPKALVTEIEEMIENR